MLTKDNQECESVAWSFAHIDAGNLMCESVAWSFAHNSWTDGPIEDSKISTQPYWRGESNVWKCRLVICP